MELPVIGTNWSGQTDFMNESNSYLIDVKALVRISDNENPLFNGHYWAEPSVKDLRKKMRQVLERPDAAKGKARQARKDLLETYDPKAISKQVIAEIEKYRIGR
ncbi:glycosyltransferase family protein [Paenibacillus hexagrammi]|uniref:Glycosyltransferase n=1 Tax=Paenibacillus hexagrammi TaxID=2908839 RepID=A0ABY3SGN0_9BACL|nr:hypothetical protein [Paenibacillus sp. YPD9-1]UJF32097.1 hypothetical protein L0M14_20515 [Paenibacillus sp. YPD9-1]